jgi:hypothetical protein
VSRGDTGDAGEKDAAAELGLFEVFGPFLNAHAAGDFAHGGEEREAALGVAESFVGEARRAGLEHGLCQVAAGSEVEIGKESLAGADERVFEREGLFDFDDEGGAGIHLGGGRDNFGSRGSVLGVEEAGADAGIGFDKDLMARARKFFDADGEHGDAVFVEFDFAGDADEHGEPKARGKQNSKAETVSKY